MREFIRYGRTFEGTRNSAKNYPTRETVINQDDLLNLKIALETNVDVKAFILDPHIFD